MKLWLLIIFFSMLIVTAFAEGTTGSETIDKNVSQERLNAPHGFCRGVVNLGTCWMEFPRVIVIEHNHIPIFGFFVGIVRGLYYTGKRLTCSILDIGLLGFTGSGGYDAEFPEYIWDAQWNPYPKKIEEPNKSS